MLYDLMVLRRSNNRKWVEKLLEIIVKMKDYVTQYHQDAVVWNAEVGLSIKSTDAFE